MPIGTAASYGGQSISIHASLAGQLARGPWAMCPTELQAVLSVMQSAQVNARAIIAEQGPRIRAREAHRAAGLAVLDGDVSGTAHTIWNKVHGGRIVAGYDDLFEPGFDAHIRPHENGARVIGVLPIRGALMTKASMCWDGYDSIQASGRSLVAMGADDLILRIGSPGGACQGATELCADIRRWRKDGVTVHAVVDFDAESAGYWIAAQADFIYISDSSIYGHGGVFTDWLDVTDLLRKDGIRHGYIEEPAGGVKTFFAGDNTEIGADEQNRKRDMVVRPIVKHFFGLYMADIEAGRGDRIDAKAAAGLMAMVYPGTSPSGDGKTGIEAGLADEVATFEDLIKTLEGAAPMMEVA